MRRTWIMAGLLLLMLSARSAPAKEDWPLNIKVLNTKNIESEHGSFRMSWGGGSGGAGWAHRVAEHAFVEASDGNSYELTPDNPKDMLLPGTFRTKIEKRDIRVCEPKDNGNCREVKFKIVAAVTTVKAGDPTPETTGVAPKTDVPTVKAGDPMPETAGVPPRAAEPARDQPAVSAPGSQATISIDSTPPGADIEIDAAFVGNTPSTVSVAPGSHQISVKKKGFTEWTKTLNVTGGMVHLNAELEQGPANQ